jgi:hypothetical protein
MHIQTPRQAPENAREVGECISRSKVPPTPLTPRAPSPDQVKNRALYLGALRRGGACLMAQQKIRQLLRALESGQASYAEGRSGAELTHVAKEVINELKRVVEDPDAKVDDQLSVLSAAFNTPQGDLLSFLIWNISDSKLKKAKKAVHDGLYDFIKEHGRKDLLNPFRERLIHHLLRVVRGAEGSETKEEALHLIKLCITLFPALLQSSKEPNNAEPRQGQPTTKTVGDVLMADLERMLSGKARGGLLGELYKCAGTVAAKLMEEPAMSDNDRRGVRAFAGRVLQKCHTTMTKDLDPSKKGVEYDIIAGGFSCITKVLHHVQGHYENEARRRQLYEWVQRMLLVKGKFNKYGIVAKALGLLEEHAPFFKDQILRDPTAAYEAMESCLPFAKQHKSHKPLEKHAQPALVSVLRVIASEGSPQTVQLFARRCSDALDQMPKGQDEALMTVLGVGMFANTLAQEEGGVTRLLTRLMTFSERASGELHAAEGRGREEGEREEPYVPGFTKAYKQLPSLRWRVAIMEAVGCILRLPASEGAKRVADAVVDTVASTCVAVMDQYYPMYKYPKERRRIRSAVLGVLLALPEGACDSLLSQVVTPAITLASSRDDLLDTSEGQRRAQVYAEMWCEILRPAPGTVKHSLEARLEALAAVMFEKLLRGSLAIIGRLQLTYKFVEDQEGGDGQELTLLPDQPYDQELFLSLVDFLSSLFGGVPPAWLARWGPFACEVLIRQASLVPHVSGFYRLLACVARALETSRVFDGEGPEGAMDVESIPLSEGDRRGLHRLLRNYALHVVNQLEQYDVSPLCEA